MLLSETNEESMHCHKSLIFLLLPCAEEIHFDRIHLAAIEASLSLEGEISCMDWSVLDSLVQVKYLDCCYRSFGNTGMKHIFVRNNLDSPPEALQRCPLLHAREVTRAISEAW